MHKNIIFIGIETTGLHCEYGDEILQVVILDENGEPLMNDYVRPTSRTTWDSRINSITPDMVKDAETLAEKSQKIIQIMQSASTIVAYDLFFVLKFLTKQTGPDPYTGKQFCSIKDGFAKVFGEHKPGYGYDDYKWQSLAKAKEYYGYRSTSSGKLDDVRAVRYIFRQIFPNLASPIAYQDKIQHVAQINSLLDKAYSCYEIKYNRLHVGDPQIDYCTDISRYSPDGSCRGCMYDCCRQSQYHDMEEFDSYIPIPEMRACEIDHNLQDDVYDLISIMEGDYTIASFFIADSWWARSPEIIASVISDLLPAHLVALQESIDPPYMPLLELS